MATKYTVLVVDDEELVRDLMVKFIAKMGYSHVTAQDGVDALDRLKTNKVDAVVTDVRMPRMDGIDLTTEISREYPGLPIMITTAYGEEYSIGTAIGAGAREFIQKPFSYIEYAIRLRKMIHDAEFLKRKKYQTIDDGDIDALRKELEELVTGASLEA
jgi:CheY-like chemotaxis protein